MDHDQQLVAGLQALLQAAGPLDQRPHQPGLDLTKHSPAQNHPHASEGDSDDDDHPDV